MTIEVEESDIEGQNDLLDRAWAIIANAGRNRREAPVVHIMNDGTVLHSDGWDTESEEWVEAAVAWREEYFNSFHEAIGQVRGNEV